MKLSVIIPIYNAEKTLNRCLDSLLSQVPADAECLLVNDGSTDGSREICLGYAQKYPQVRLIDKENGGVSSARNAGLDAAKGQYVLFVDSDDYVPASLFSDVEAELRRGDWDLVRFSYCVDDGESKCGVISKAAEYSSRRNAFPKLIDDICSKMLNPPWDKVYRREILDREAIRFPLGASVAEDRAFNIKYSMYVNNYRISDRIAYFVSTENEQSLSRKRYDDLSGQFRITGTYVLDAIRDAAVPDAEKALYRRAYDFGLCRSVYKNAKDLRRDQLSWFQRQKKLWDLCGEINRRHMKYPRTFYCQSVSLPVRLRQTWLIDSVARRLMQYR